MVTSLHVHKSTAKLPDLTPSSNRPPTWDKAISCDQKPNLTSPGMKNVTYLKPHLNEANDSDHCSTSPEQNTRVWPVANST